MDAIVLFDPISSGEMLKKTAKHLGFAVIAVFTRPLELFQNQYHTTQETLYRDTDLVIVGETLNEILPSLREAPFSIRAAIAGLDSGVELADQVSHALHLFGNPLKYSSARRDKGEMRKLLKEKGLSYPQFALCSTTEKVSQFARAHPWPLVIKTPRGAATSQVYICKNEKKLLEAFQEISQVPSFFGERAKYAVLEEYISGEEYIVDTFSDGKKVHVTDIWIYEKKEHGHAQNVTYNAISIPLLSPIGEKLAKEGIRIVQAFGIERGPAHLEIKDDPLRGPTLIEINARLVGARLPFLMQKYTNFDLYRATIEIFVKGKIAVPDPILASKHFAIVCRPLFEDGRVRSIHGIDAIEKLASYEFHILAIKPGDLIVETTYSTTTPLFVYLAHENREQLLRDVKAAHDLFQVKLDRENE